MSETPSMTREQFLEKYGDARVRFVAYYKYSFTFSGPLPDGGRVVVHVGGSSDDIYRFEVDSEECVIREIDARCEVGSGDVYAPDGAHTEGYYAAY